MPLTPVCNVEVSATSLSGGPQQAMQPEEVLPIGHVSPTSGRVVAEGASLSEITSADILDPDWWTSGLEAHAHGVVSSSSVQNRAAKPAECTAVSEATALPGLTLSLYSGCLQSHCDELAIVGQHSAPRG